MPKGYSLHIGVNKVDASKYEKEAKPLASCLNDANAMANIALQKKYTKITILRNKTATKENFVFFMEQYARELEAGDIFLLSFSGHGMQAETIDQEKEGDKIDEGWCFYDGFVRDKELLEVGSSLKKGVRIIVVSDSCYSGDVYRFTPPHLFQRSIKEDQAVEASCLLMAASEEINEAVTNQRHGLFTQGILDALKNPMTNKTYTELIEEIDALAPLRSPPVFLEFGQKYENSILPQAPFKNLKKIIA